MQSLSLVAFYQLGQTCPATMYIIVTPIYSNVCDTYLAVTIPQRLTITRLKERKENPYVELTPLRLIPAVSTRSRRSLPGHTTQPGRWGDFFWRKTAL